MACGYSMAGERQPRFRRTAQQLRKLVGLSEPGLETVVRSFEKSASGVCWLGAKKWILHVCDLKVCFNESA